MPKRFDEFASHHFYETPKHLYRRTYFEAYNVIQGTEKRFQQKDFLTYRNIQDIFLNAINGKDSSQQLKVVCGAFKNDLNPTNLQVQLKQFANLFQDKPNCLIDTLLQVLSTFGKNKSQKILLPDVVKLARLFLVMPATNASSERAFSGMKRIKTYLRNSTTSNCLNHCMVVHVHVEDVDKMKTIEIAREFIEYSQT